MDVRIDLDCIKTLTYNCGEQDYKVLEQVNDDLKQITATMQKQLPESEGLLVRPQLKTRDLVKQKRMKLGISQIPSRRQAERGQVQHTEIDMDGKLQHSERYIKDNRPHYTTINPNDLCTYKCYTGQSIGLPI